ncbi:MAG: selenoprotein B glycine/betaine/sarcosine/D-proline reductase [Alphaproteobacteria bacterium]|nr:selenoprotein B glycine/betaine/sarcosine/D-proline reductase [Alphaproteobacteria bacterium]
MARLERLPDFEREYLLGLPLPEFPTTAWVTPPDLARCRVAIVSTAGLQRRGDAPFAENSADYRVIPGDIGANDLVMSHISVNFDRSGFQQDLNIAFPLDRLKELAAEGVIASVADYHYAFMGATDPRQMESGARHVAGMMKVDQVNAVILVPV